MPKLERNESRRRPLLKILLIYHDFVSAAKANAALQLWAEVSGTGAELIIRPWRMDMLKFPPLAGEALDDARDVHLLVFVGQCALAIPFWFEDWLEDWAGSRRFQDAMLVVINADLVESEHPPVSPQLVDFAQRHHLEVLHSNSGDLNGGPSVVNPSQLGGGFRINNLTEPILREVSEGVSLGWGSLKDSTNDGWIEAPPSQQHYNEQRSK